MLLPNLQVFLNNLLKIVADSWFLWLPIVLALAFWETWMRYIRAKFIANLEWILLETKLPREISKSPKAMETIFNSFYQTKDGNFKEKYWQGFLRPWFSLELAGINGEIHFFIYMQKGFRNLIEAHIYSQYPDVELVEVDDYTKEVFLESRGSDKWSLWGTEFVLVAEDAYPIKTYVDYGLHEVLTKEEQKNDPLTTLIEFFGSLKEGEQAWFQVMIRATKKDWKEEGKKLVEKLMERDKKLKEGEQTKKLSPGETDVIKAIERDVSKYGFDTGIRAMYLALKDKFVPANIGALIGATKHYNTINLNGFKPARTTGLDYFWQLKKIREPKMKTKMIDAYRLRSYFYPPYDRKPFVLNTEELATIFHFPGRVAETPTFRRIEAKKSEAPVNLPV